MLHSGHESSKLFLHLLFHFQLDPLLYFYIYEFTVLCQLPRQLVFQLPLQLKFHNSLQLSSHLFTFFLQLPIHTSLHLLTHNFYSRRYTGLYVCMLCDSFLGGLFPYPCPRNRISRRFLYLCKRPCTTSMLSCLLFPIFFCSSHLQP